MCFSSVIYINYIGSWSGTYAFNRRPCMCEPECLAHWWSWCFWKLIMKNSPNTSKNFIIHGLLTHQSCILAYWRLLLLKIFQEVCSPGPQVSWGWNPMKMVTILFYPIRRFFFDFDLCWGCFRTFDLQALRNWCLAIWGPNNLKIAHLANHHSIFNLFEVLPQF